MTDLATLGLEVDSAPMARARDELGRFVGAAKAAQTAAAGLEGQAASTGAEMTDTAAAAKAAADALARAGQAAGQAGAGFQGAGGGAEKIMPPLGKLPDLARQSAMQMQMLSFQLNDVATMALSGASAFQILATQGGQVFQILQMAEDGARGTLSRMATGLLALATPANLAIAGFSALGAGLLAYAALSRETLPSLDDALKAHADAISRIKKAYGEAAVAADAYGRESRSVLTAVLQSDIRGLEAQVKAAQEIFTQQTTFQQSYTRSGMGPRVLRNEFQPFAIDIAQYRAGAESVRQLRDAIASTISLEPIDSDVRKAGEKLLLLTDPLSKIDSSLGQARGTMLAFGRDAVTAAAEVATFNKALSDLADIARPELSGLDQISALLAKGGAAATSGDEIRALNAAADAARQRLADASVPLPRERPNDLAGNAYSDAYTAAEERLRQLANEVDSLGKASSAAEAFRLQQDLLTAALKDETKVTDDQWAAIDKLTDSYEKLLLTQARVKLSSDLDFARSQIGRSPVDQQVATMLRGIYGDDYLAHMQDFEAQQIRNNAALRAMSDAGRAANDNLEQMRERLAEIGMPAVVAARRMAGLLSDQQSRAAGISGTPQAASLRTLAVEQAGYNTVAERTLATWDEIKGTGESAIDSLTSKIGEGTLSLTDFLDVARDIGKEFTKLAIANPLKNALFGENLPTLSDAQGLLGGLFGGKSNPALDAASAALSTTVGAMTVTAGSVVVSGGLGIGAGDALSGAARSVGIGSDAVAGGSGLDRAAAAIRSMESSGNYGARGPVLDTGDRAYGAYQVMGNNIGPWSKRWLGRALTPSEFLADPSAQDAVFRGQFGSYADRYGATGAAQAWFGGPGSVGQVGRSDILGTSVGDYGAKFDSLVNQSGRSLKDMADAATSATKAATDLGSGLGDLSSGFANLAQRLTGSASAAGNSNWLSNIIASMTPGATGWLHANGNAFSRGTVIPYARGDVFDRPHIFPMARGAIGMLGEAGPEAIMPLRRTASGRLGVEAGGKGGGGVNVIVNNNGSTTRASTEERTNASGQREVIVTVDEMTASAVQRRGGATDRALAGRGLPVRTRKLS